MVFVIIVFKRNGGAFLDINSVYTQINDKIGLTEIITNKFKKRLFSINLILPAEIEKIGSYLMIPRLVTTSCKKYPSLFKMNRMLASNFGTTITGSTSFCGDNLVIHLKVSFIGDEYVISSANVEQNAINSLFDCILEPNAENGCFDREIFEDVRRICVENINSKIDNKLKYAVARLRETMCAGEAFGITDSLMLKKIEEASPEKAYNDYLEALKTAHIEIYSVGDVLSDEIKNTLYNAFPFDFKRYDGIKNTIIKTSSSELKIVKEPMNVSQGQLLFGLRSLINKDSKYFYAAKVFADILGGGTYSLLFSNVREKDNICYYCSCGYFVAKGILLIYSGVDFDKIDDAKVSILEQLDSIKNGNFSEELIVKSKCNFENALISVYDTPDTVSGWYFGSIFDNPTTSVDEFIKNINSVTKEDIIAVANMFTLDTEYRIVSEG